MLTGRTATPYSHNSNSKSKSTSSNLDSKNTQTNIMHLYKSAIVLLAAAPAITAEVNFEQYDADISTNNPQISQDSWTVTIDGKVTGLGSDGPNTKFYGYTAGFIDTVCINGGSETPPGQNRDSITLSGSVVGTTDSDSNGAYAYDLVMSENCSCGKEGATFEAVVGKGKDKALTEFQCDNGPFVDDLDGDGGVCCGAVREGDEVDCGGEYLLCCRMLFTCYKAHLLISYIDIEL